MKIIYHCWGGSHSSVVCAAIHLGRLPRDRVPTAAELRALPEFDRQTKRDHGRMFHMGRDERGNDVYFLGRRSNGAVIDRILPGMVEVFGLSRDEIITMNTSPYVNPLMVIGGTLSRALGLVRPGRAIVTLGARLAHRRLCRAVEEVQRRAAQRRERGLLPCPGRAGGGEDGAARELPLFVFYHCYGSAHASVVAAGIHLGLLPSDARPEPAAIAALPHYDRTTVDLIGTPFRIGVDERGRVVCIVGMVRGMRVIRRAVRCLLHACGLPQDRLLFVDCLPLVNLRMRIGGFLSRQLGLIRLGRPLTISGVLANYDRFCRAVARVRAWLRRIDGR